MYDIIIIGGGPAGITAAIYGKRAGNKVLILEAKKVGGAMLKAHLIDNYPGLYHITGEELADKFLDQIKELDIEIKYEKAINIMDNNNTKIVQTEENMYETKAIIIATGFDKRKLGLPNEEKLLGKGVSYCATCDGNFFKNKDVAIIGGGEHSKEEALYLANICNKVYYITPRKVDNLDKDNIEIIIDKPSKINGTNKVESLSLEKNDDIEVSGVFIAIASVPETSYLLTGIDLDDKGNVISNEELKTNKNGIFVAGDIRNKKLKQVSTAVSDGALAATFANEYIRSLSK